MTEYILQAKVMIAALMSAACFVMLRYAPLRHWLECRSWKAITLIFLIPRLAAFITLYVLLRLPVVSDVSVYLKQARAVAGGLRPYIDVPTAYGPWFILFTAWAVKVWDSGAVLVLLSVLFELAAWPLWIMIMRRLLQEREAKLSALLYAIAPLPFLNVPMVGMNHIWISAFLALAFLWQQRGRFALSGLAMGASVVVVKFLSLLWVPLLFWQTRKKFIWGLCFVILPVVAYGMIYFQGADLTAQIKFHAQDNSSGNLPFLLGLAGMDPSHPTVRFVCNILGMAGLALLFCLCVWTRRLVTFRQLFLALPLFLLLALMLSKKSYASYLLIVTFPLAALAVLEHWRWRTSLWFAIAMLTTSIEPSLWFQWLQHQELPRVLAGNSIPASSCWKITTFVCVDLLMIASYAALGWRLWVNTAPAGSDHVMAAA